MSQNITVTFDNLSRDETVTFDTVANNVALSNWTQDPTLPNFRHRIYTVPKRVVKGVLGPNASTTYSSDIACLYQNVAAQACDADEINLAHSTAYIPNSTQSTVTTTASIDIEVTPDRGAILADVLIQDFLAGYVANDSGQVSRAFNGGRPF